MTWTCKEHCNKYKSCKSSCEMILHIVKDKPLRERLAPPDINDISSLDTSTRPPTSIDYKDVLHANIQARRDYIPTTIKEVKNIPDTNLRAIAAMLYAHISIKEIAFMLDKSERTIKRLCGLP